MQVDRETEKSFSKIPEETLCHWGVRQITPKLKLLFPVPASSSSELCGRARTWVWCFRTKPARDFVSSIHKEQRLTWRLIGSPAVEYPTGTTRPGIPVKLPSCMNLGGKSCHQYSWGQQQIHPFLVKAATINLSHLTVWGSSSPAVPKLVSVVQVALSLPYGPDYEGHIAVPSQEVRFINSWGSARNSCGGITKWLNLKGTSEVILSNLAQEC